MLRLPLPADRSATRASSRPAPVALHAIRRLLASCRRSTGLGLGILVVCLLNTDRSTPIELKRGDLIAQLVVQQVVRVRFEPVDELPDSARGAGGHGSTGGIANWSDTTDPTGPDGGNTQ